PDRLPVATQAGNRAPFFQRKLFVCFSHDRNTLSGCCTSFVNLGDPVPKHQQASTYGACRPGSRLAPG
ncbi:MAG: hypothetical protein P4M15_11450, partial [Alphaproteobacteria bacterium]|nr:hypothetical protein [Alphaproteobacteria bacterium]